jgi:acyl transferase domain-containing protein/acyl carrier protein
VHIQESDTLNGSEIAIIGLSGRFPGAKNITEFWQNLQNGVESISFFSDAELLAVGIEPTVVNDPNFVKARGVLDDVELFDAAFFGFNPREAEITDPQHRLFLETAWEAIENAGYDTESYAGTIGVFAGTGLSDYLLRVYSNQNILNSLDANQLAIAGDKDYLTTRVSYKLNLTGPSYTVQTACSTSLVAVHLACQSLLAGECDISLAGGVSINSARKAGYFYKQGGIGSPDGHCRAFDAKAQGTVSGEGVGIVVLKRLEDAIAEGDNVYAVIKGSAINNDGSNKVSYTAPSIDSQAKVIKTAQIIAEVEADTITYIEAHGTGTSLGDPIEIAALTQAFRSSTEKRGFCAIGSLKTNIGHLDTAAGIAGLIKTVLALKYQKIPPSLHFEKSNPQIDFASSPFYVNTKLTDWQTNAIPRRAGVSSFGIGGTNGHVILEEAPPVVYSSSSSPWQLLVLSAKTSTALSTATTNLTNFLQQNHDLNLADIAYTLQIGRKAFEHRQFLVCQNLDDAITSLKSPQNLEYKQAENYTHPAITFMFPGQGSQYVNMGRELYDHEPIFRAKIDDCAEFLKPHLGLDLRHVIYPNTTGNQELTQTAIAQPAIFAIAYALSQLWMSWGVHPEAAIGHSIGEYVAATIAGVFSLDTALTLVAMRGKLMQQIPPGSMLAVQLTESEVLPLLGTELALAAHNAPSACVVSGTTEAINKLQQQLEQKGISCRKLHTSHAFHSQMMDGIMQPFTEQLQKIQFNSPQIPFISNVSGNWITTEEATNPNYWAKHLRSSVLFCQGLTELLKQPSILLEVGAGRTLTTFAKQQQKTGLVTLNSLRHPQEQQSDVAFLLNTLGHLWQQGVKIDWSKFYVHEKRNRLPLPTYPFERQRYWIEASPKVLPRQEEEKHQVSLSKKLDIAEWFYVPSWKLCPQVETVKLGVDITSSRCCLVFGDECGLGEQIARKIAGDAEDVIIVKAGEKFVQKSDRVYTINPQQHHDYNQLFQALRSLGKIPTNIIHLWTVTADNLEKLAAEKYEELGFYSLLFLAQALGEFYQKDALKIWVISNQMQTVTGYEKLCPEKALILGPCKVIPEEYANITCHSIDIDLAVPLAGSWQEEQIIKQILADIFNPTSDRAIAYRGYQRWVEDFTSLRLDAAITANPLLKQKGVYLIVGGLGGVGLALGEYLAQTVQAKLILLGRSPFPHPDEWQKWLSTHDAQDAISQKILKLQSLEALGTEIMVVSADVANYEQMSAVMTTINQRFGNINGVIHAAAVPGGGMMQLTTKEVVADAIAAKVKGTRVLDAVLADIPLDFWIFCSSLSSFLPRWGMVDYIAGNAFLDAFAHYRTARYNTFTTSINWDHWHSLGMAVTVEQRYKEITGKELTVGMTVTEGIEVFKRILSVMSQSVIPQVVVSTQDFPTLLESKKSAKSLEEKLTQLSETKTSHPRPDLGNTYVAPQSELEKTLAEIWQQLFGINNVGIHDNFFELGGDSLFATQLVSQLCKIFQIELSYKSFFSSPTIAELAEDISQKLAEQVEQDQLAKALVEIEQLSEDETHKIFVLQEQLIEAGGLHD